MTIHEDHGRKHDADDSRDRFDVTRGTPADRVRWGAVLAGTFAAFTTLAILSTLGAAIGLTSYDRGEDDLRNFAMAGGAWGIVSTVAAFALGGWVAARAAAARGRDNGLLNGALVAAVGIPLMLFMFGSAATALSSAEVSNGREQARGQFSDDARTAAARIADTATGGDNAPDARVNPPVDDSDRARRAAGRTAWSVLTGMILAVAASAGAGYIGARRDDEDDYDDRRSDLRSDPRTTA